MKWRIPRFSMRTLLLTMLLLGVLFGLLGREIVRLRQEAAEENETVRVFAEKGATLQFRAEPNPTLWSRLIAFIDGRQNAPVRSVMLVGPGFDLLDIKRFSQLKHLEGISLYCYNANDEWLKELAKCKKLRLVHVQDTVSTARGANLLAASRSPVSVMVLPDIPIDDAFLQSAAQSPTLQTLLIDGRNLTAQGVARLAESTTISSLSIHGGENLGKGFEGLARLRTLRGLSWSQEKISEQEIAGLSKLDSIDSLSISTSSFPPQALSTLSKMKSLRTLELSGELSDQETVSEIEFQALQSFVAKASKLPDGTLAQLASCKSLLSITARGEEISDAELNALAKLPQLNMLAVAASPSKEAIDAFQMAQPYCVYIDKQWGFFQPKIGINPATLGGGVNRNSIVAPPNLR